MKTESITVSLAQISVFKGDVQKNLTMHLELIAQSARHNADVIVFPELSLIGYELELMKMRVLQPNDAVISVLSKAAVMHNMVVIAGCPLPGARSNNPLLNHSEKPSIGAIIALPSGDVEFYNKQYLHEGEDVFCSAGSQNYSLSIKGFKLGLAICADFVNPQHAADMATLNVDAYLVSALISTSGFDIDAGILSNIAAQYKTPVLLANYASETGGYLACGKSSAWDTNGQLITLAKSTEVSIFVCHVSRCGKVASMAIPE